MIWAARIADETAEHYAELRQRRIPMLPAVLMTMTFHRILCRAVLWDDQFEDAVASMLGPIKEDDKA